MFYLLSRLLSLSAIPSLLCSGSSLSAVLFAVSVLSAVCSLCRVISAMLCLLSPVFVPCLQHPVCCVLCHVLSLPLSAVSCLPHLLCPVHHVSSVVCCLPGPDCCARCARTCLPYTACSCGHTLAYGRPPSWVLEPLRAGSSLSSIPGPLLGVHQGHVSFGG